MNSRSIYTARGFTLIEIAIVLVVVALLIGGLLTPLTTQIQNRKIEQTRLAMDEIKQALVGFAVANGFLPCPDVTGDGVVDACVTTAFNGTNAGWVPWATLGISGTDAWGNRFRYQVTGAFTTAHPAIPPHVAAANDNDLELGDTGTMIVLTRDGNKVDTPLAGTVAVTNGVPVVLISYGPNGYGATTNAGGVIPNPPALVNIDELINVGGAAGVFNTPIVTFKSRPIMGVSRSIDCSDTVNPAIPLCEFDDIVVWIPAPTLFKAMVDAGRLP